MPFLGRALYNLLQTKVEKGTSETIADWQVRDYRALSIDELLKGLNDLGLDIDIDQFEVTADQVDSPEEIAASVAPPGEPRERIYLFVFELWRRFLDDRETISIFCDELDQVISAYEDDPASTEEIAYSMLKELVGILEQNVILGQKPVKLFSTISDFLSHDLESFIYNFIQDLIEQDRPMAASEITSNFIPYVEQTLWFDLLKIKLIGGASVEEASAMASRFLEKLEEAPELDLYFELLYYLNKTGHKELFESVYKKALELVNIEADYIEILDILFEYYHLNDRKRDEKVVEEILLERKKLTTAKSVTKQEIKYLQEFVR